MSGGPRETQDGPSNKHMAPFQTCSIWRANMTLSEHLQASERTKSCTTTNNDAVRLRTIVRCGTAKLRIFTTWQNCTIPTIFL